MKFYPKPDYLAFCKSVVGMTACLVVLHWTPDLAIWFHAHVLGERLVVDARSFRAVLMVAYLICGISLLVGISGLAWATWHYPRRRAFEARREQRMAKGIDVEIAERTAERKRQSEKQE